MIIKAGLGTYSNGSFFIPTVNLHSATLEDSYKLLDVNYTPKNLSIWFYNVVVAFVNLERLF